MEALHTVFFSQETKRVVTCSPFLLYTIGRGDVASAPVYEAPTLPPMQDCQMCIHFQFQVLFFDASDVLKASINILILGKVYPSRVLSRSLFEKGRNNIQ